MDMAVEGEVGAVVAVMVEVEVEVMIVEVVGVGERRRRRRGGNGRRVLRGGVSIALGVEGAGRK